MTSKLANIQIYLDINISGYPDTKSSIYVSPSYNVVHVHDDYLHVFLRLSPQYGIILIISI